MTLQIDQKMEKNRSMRLISILDRIQLLVSKCNFTIPKVECSKANFLCQLLKMKSKVKKFNCYMKYIYNKTVKYII